MSPPLVILKDIPKSQVAGVLGDRSPVISRWLVLKLNLLMFQLPFYYVNIGYKSIGKRPYIPNSAYLSVPSPALLNAAHLQLTLHEAEK